MKCFTIAANKLLTLGGRFIISLPSAGTRPGIDQEISEYLRFARQVGFSVELHEQNILSYETPYFEANSLASAGIPNVPREWRKGTLCVLRKEFHINSEMPIHCEPTIPWTKVVVQGCQFRFKSNHRLEFDNPLPSSIIDGDILPTVSSRSPCRAKADVWTSGNRVFACAAPTILAVIALCINDHSEPILAVQKMMKKELDADQRFLVCQAKDWLLEIARIELTESSKYTFVSINLNANN